MKEFITALQFLTRINILQQDKVSPENFGRSVKYFPVVGAVIGAVLAGVNFLCGGYFPIHTLTALLITLEIFITGGLHCDGLMDTMDGIFSSRSQGRMLEIMKDSRVGANGVVAFGLFLLIKGALMLDLLPAASGTAFFLMPVLGRFAMVIGITVFPYARPEGLGKAFAEFAGRFTLYIAGAITVLITLPLGKAAILSLVVTVVFAILFSRYVTRLLGGLTGDVYGALTEITELLVLATFLLSRELGALWWR